MIKREYQYIEQKLQEILNEIGMNIEDYRRNIKFYSENDTY